MKIAIADPQSRIRFSLRILLEQQPGWLVNGEAADGQQLLDLLRAAPPDVLLVAMDLPGVPPEGLLRGLRAGHPALRIIAMSGRQEHEPAALSAGADAFACKADSPEKLLNLIRACANQAGSSS